MPESVEDKLAFVMTCLKHTSQQGKPDFEAVAAELGLKPTTCYHRHWRMMSSWGIGSGKSASGDASNKSSSKNTIPKTPGVKATKSTSATGRKTRTPRKKRELSVSSEAEDKSDAEPVLKKSKVEDDEKDSVKDEDLEEKKCSEVVNIED